jgi:hypothetical protein
MHIAMSRGRERLTLEVDDARCIGAFPSPPALADPADAVRHALDAPLEYPALRRALTPDDRVAVVLDESLPDLARLLAPVLEHVASAGVSLAGVVLVCAAGDGKHAWIDDLPDELGDVHLEDHDPKDKKKLAYMATTQSGRRIYLNRTVVEADQVIVLTGRRFDPVLGHAGGETSIFPVLADEETRYETMKLAPKAIFAEATEVAWLFGQPFHVQLIHSGGDGIAEVIAGARDATQRGRERLDAGWSARVPHHADTVVVSVGGDPARHTFGDLARAAYTASKVVQPDGRIVILSDAAPPVAPGLERLARGEEPEDVLNSLRKANRAEFLPAVHWLRAMTRARLSLWSRLPAAVVEDLGATPLEEVAQVQRLVSASKGVVFLEDGHRRRAKVTE